VSIPDGCFTAESVPLDTPILVWVRDIQRIGSVTRGAWKSGYAAEVWDGDNPNKRVLRADTCSGNWDIPYWRPMPEAPE
jgi:hypothetical protein